MRIEHIGIYARDIETLAQWYVNVLGMKIICKLERKDRLPVYFLKSESETELELLPTSTKLLQRELGDPGYSHICIVVDNFEKAIQSLREKGIKIEGVRTTSSGGWTTGYFTDPEGNYLEILYRPRGT
jgi:glyoxylase I family protein